MENLSEQFSQIYDQYIDKIYRFVYLKVNSQEVAEDITSKVFTRGWDAFKAQPNAIKNPSAFLYQIARNAVIDHYREKGRSKIVSSEISPELIDPGTTAYEKAILSVDVSLVRTAILGLKKEYQDVLIWHYLEDMSIAQIAENLGKPAGTIRVILHRGLKELKGLIKEV